MLNISYTQEQELLSDYYAVHIHFCVNNSLHVADNSYNDCFIRVYIYEWYKYTIMCYHTKTVLLVCIDRSQQFSINS